MGFWKKDYQPKYVAKVPLKKVFGKQTYRYFYTMSAYRSYLKSKENTSKPTNTQTVKPTVQKTAPTTIGKAVAKVTPKEEKTSVVDKIATALSTIATKTVKEVSETVSKGKAAVDQVRTKTVKQVSEHVEKGKDAVDKAVLNVKMEIAKKTVAQDGHRISPKPDEKNNGVKTTGISYDEIANKYPEITKVLPKKTIDNTLKEERDIINPFYESEEWPFDSNCYSCSMSYDLRKRGFDTQAIVDIYGGMYGDDIASCYDDGEFSDFNLTKCDAPEEAADMMRERLLAESNGEDSYGFITIDWKPFGGHIFNYEIINGEVTFVDTQPRGDDYPEDHVANIEEYLARSKYQDTEDALQFMRTDNLMPNENILLATSPATHNQTNVDIKGYNDMADIVERAIDLAERGVIESDDDGIAWYDMYLSWEDVNVVLDECREELEKLKR